MANQLKKKFIGNDQVDGDKILLLEGQDIRRIVDGQVVNGFEQVSIELAAEAAARLALETELEGSISTETQRALAAEAVIQAELSSLVNSLDSRDAATLSFAQSYTDSKVAEAKLEILGSIDDTTLDTIREVADRLKSDETATGVILSKLGEHTQSISQLSSQAISLEQSLASEVAARIESISSLEERLENTDSALATETQRALAAEAVLEGKLVSEKARAQASESLLEEKLATEKSRAESAEAELSSRILSLEAEVPQFNKMVMTVTSALITAGFVDLDHTALTNSLTATYDRLNMFEEEDFLISVVGGKTRITFTGNLIDPSPEALAVGDVLRFRYQY